MMRILAELPRTRTPWQARLLGGVLGVLGPVVLALSVRAPAPRVPREPAAPERIVALGLPSLPDEPLPVVDGTTPAPAPGMVAPTSPARDRATPGFWTGPVTTPRADSSGAGDPARPGAASRVPGGRELFGSPAAGRPLCLPPCGGSGPAVAAGAGGGAGPGIAFPPMSRAERDSIAHAVITAAAAAGGGESHPASTLPAGVAGVSLPVGLPGGGPTRAQRERARVLDADVSARLARIRARADSLAELRRRDSVARAMPRGEPAATTVAPGNG